MFVQEAFLDALDFRGNSGRVSKQHGLIKTGTQNEGQAVVKLDHTWHVALFAQLLTALPNLTMQPKAWSNSFSSKAIVKRQ